MRIAGAIEVLPALSAGQVAMAINVEPLSGSIERQKVTKDAIAKQIADLTKRIQVLARAQRVSRTRTRWRKIPRR